MFPTQEVHYVKTDDVIIGSGIAGFQPRSLPKRSGSPDHHLSEAPTCLITGPACQVSSSTPKAWTKSGSHEAWYEENGLDLRGILVTGVDTDRQEVILEGERQA